MHVDQHVELLAGDRRDRHDVGEVAQLVDTASSCSASVRPVDQVGLGDDRDHGALSSAISAAMNLSPAPDRLVGRDAQADHVDLAPGRPDQVVEALAEQRLRLVQAGGVDEDQLRVRPGAAPRARRAGWSAAGCW